MDGEPAPPGPDLDHVVLGPEPELRAHELELGHRRLGERHPRLAEVRARVHHRLVEHQLEQVVAEVVVGGDVVARLRSRSLATRTPRRACTGTRARREPPPPRIERGRVARGHADQRGQVGRVPQPVHVALGQPAAAAQEQRPGERRADLDRGLRRAAADHDPPRALHDRQLARSASAARSPSTSLRASAGLMPPPPDADGPRTPLQPQHDRVAVDQREHAPRARHRAAVPGPVRSVERRVEGQRVALEALDVHRQRLAGRGRAEPIASAPSP